jgi:uncharacterized protein (DUF1778 family)
MGGFSSSEPGMRRRQTGDPPDRECPVFMGYTAFWLRCSGLISVVNVLLSYLVEHPSASGNDGWLDIRVPYCHRKYMASLKADRLQIRVDPADKALLERAAAAAHLNVSAFVVQAAAARAEQVLAERPSIRLSSEAAAAFTEALEEPAEVNERLARALRRKRKFAWLD